MKFNEALDTNLSSIPKSSVIKDEIKKSINKLAKTNQELRKIINGNGNHKNTERIVLNTMNMLSTVHKKIINVYDKVSDLLYYSTADKKIIEDLLNKLDDKEWEFTDIKADLHDTKKLNLTTLYNKHYKKN